MESSENIEEKRPLDDLTYFPSKPSLHSATPGSSNNDEDGDIKSKEDHDRSPSGHNLRQ